MTGSIGTQGIPPRISADAVSSVCVVPEMPQKPRVMCNVYPCPNYAVRRGQCAVHLTAYERYRVSARDHRLAAGRATGIEDIVGIERIYRK